MARRFSSLPKVSDLVFEAYGILERRTRERRDWDDGTSTDPEGEQSNESDSKKPAKDTYEDVSSHAKALLGCIVDTGELDSSTRS
jgi:hypothetical protein